MLKFQAVSSGYAVLGYLGTWFLKWVFVGKFAFWEFGEFFKGSLRCILQSFYGLMFCPLFNSHTCSHISPVLTCPAIFCSSSLELTSVTSWHNVTMMYFVFLCAGNDYFQLTVVLGVFYFTLRCTGYPQGYCFLLINNCTLWNAVFLNFIMLLSPLRLLFV